MGIPIGRMQKMGLYGLLFVDKLGMKFMIFFDFLLDYRTT